MSRHFEGKEFICKECGIVFRRSQSEIARNRVSFCSTACSGKHFSNVNSPNYKHGEATRKAIPSAEWRAWSAMLDRCYCKSSSPYYKYGARGIGVCSRWREKTNGFNNFLADMGRKPTPKHSVDRIDGTRDYSPKNCRWATNYEQSNNQRSNVKVIWKGEKMNVSQVMRKLGIYTESGVYYGRLALGWPVEKVFLTPVKKRG